MRRLALVAALGLLALPAAAQEPPAPVVDELVSRAYGDVPWWKVSDKDSTVWILALPPASIPKGMTVDISSTERRFKGARVVITPPNGRSGLPLTARGNFSRLMRDLNASQKDELEAKLSPEIRARFVKAREEAKLPASRYGALSPGLAGMALAGDVMALRQKDHPVLQQDEIIALVADVARRNRVRTEPARVYGGFPDFLKEGRRPGVDCLVSALDYLDADKPAAPPDRAADERIIKAWLDGDIRPGLERLKDAAWTGLAPDGLLMGQMRITRSTGSMNFDIITGPCVRAMPSHQKIIDTYVSSHTDAVRRALRKKGHSVAVFNAYPLLAKGGVLDVLGREGFTVTTPAQN